MDVCQADYKNKTIKLLVTVDHYSDFFEIDILKDMTPFSIIECCKRNFSRHGIPARICTDNGTNFYCSEFHQFCSTWDIEQVTSSPHNPKGNGKVESAVKAVKRLIKKSNDIKEDLWYSLLHWRNTPNNINSSPVERLYSRNTRASIPTAIENLKPKIVKNVPETIEQHKQKTKQYYDRNSRELPQLKIGDPVVVQLNPEKSKKWTHGFIERTLPSSSYMVNVNGTEYRRSAIHIKPAQRPVNIGEDLGQPKDKEQSLLPLSIPEIPTNDSTTIESSPNGRKPAEETEVPEKEVRRS